MKILFATSEAGPFIRTGGLGDVAGALPYALEKNKIDVRVILPLYEDIPLSYKNTMNFIGSCYVPLGWRKQYAGVFKLISDGVTYYFIDNEYYFKRCGIYGHFDDGERFAYFSRAVLEVLPLIDFYPDVLHVNDWQTSLIPVFLDCFYRKNKNYTQIKTLLTIHNIQFQGNYSPYMINDVLGLSEKMVDLVSYAGDCNFLKGGIESSSAVNTVSKTYAGEILDPFFAYGLEDILRQRQFKLSGVINGIDVNLYNPWTDKALFKRYSATNIEGKAANKLGLQSLLNLPQNPKKPIIAMVTRLTDQKGLDLLSSILDEILGMDIQMVVLGTGDWKYENLLREYAHSYSSKLASVISFSSDLASKIYAGADMILMPSKFEPCGLSQMIAMRYGTLPIVRETGGLKDSVPAYNHITGEGVGFTFKSYNAYDMLDAVKRAVGLYYDFEADFKKVVLSAMSQDFSWNNSAKEYIKLYKSL